MATEAELELRRREAAIKEAEMAQKSKEDKAASGPGGIIGSILSMGSSIGGMIPSLKKSGQNAELEKFQRGQGAGASMARQTASEAARRVVGASTVNAASGRGGSLREGLRAADSIVQRGAQQAAITASREGLAATQMLRQNEMVRRNAIRTLGAGVGQGLAGISGMLAASRDQGPVQPGQGTDVLPGEQALLEGQGLLPQTVDQATGLALPPNANIQGQADTDQTIASGQAGLDQFRGGQPQGPPTADQPAPMQGTGDFAVPGGIGGQMQDARQRGAASFEEPNAEDVQAQQVANQQAINLQELAQVTAEKQDAADAYRRAVSDRATLTSGPDSKTQPFDQKDPWSSAEWAYREAENYNPMMQLGMHPEQVGLMLMDWGLQPDWERLGVQATMGGKGALK